MRQFFGAFLILLMLMPSLACAMPICVEPAKKTITTSKPCHDESSSQKLNEQKNDHIHFMIDCLGVDLQKADTQHFEKGNFKIHIVDLPFTNETAFFLNPINDHNIIRGPPLIETAHSHFYPSVINTTQRLRI